MNSVSKLKTISSKMVVVYNYAHSIRDHLLIYNLTQIPSLNSIYIFLYQSIQLSFQNTKWKNKINLQKCTREKFLNAIPGPLSTEATIYV